MPTIYDPFSNACLEAIAAGLPVVTTIANGFAEILTPGVHGRRSSSRGMCQTLAQALETWRSRDAATTAKACRLLAENYSIERNVEATLDVIKGLIPRSGEGGSSSPLSSRSRPLFTKESVRENRDNRVGIRQIIK